MAYAELEPFGEHVADMRHGITAALHANLNRDPKKRPEPYQPKDFIYWHEGNRQQEKEEEKRPILLQDAEAQSRLLKAALFGIKPK